MEPIFYTVREINGDYAELVTDGGQEHSITMFLLPEGNHCGKQAEAGEFSVGAAGGIEKLADA